METKITESLLLSLGLLSVDGCSLFSIKGCDNLLDTFIELGAVNIHKLDCCNPFVHYHIYNWYIWACSDDAWRGDLIFSCVDDFKKYIDTHSEKL